MVLHVFFGRGYPVKEFLLEDGQDDMDKRVYSLRIEANGSY